MKPEPLHSPVADTAIQEDARPAIEVDPAEQVWIDAARNGDCAAFDRLCDVHGDRLLQQALVLCGERGWAEDLVQETLIAAWRSLHRFHGGCRFFTWLCSILIHRHGSGLRSRWHRARRVLDSFTTTDGEHRASQIAAPELEATTGDEARWILENLRRLPLAQREVIQLRFFAGESLAGIATATGVPEGTVKSRLFHALNRLRAMKPPQSAPLP